MTVCSLAGGRTCWLYIQGNFYNEDADNMILQKTGTHLPTTCPHNSQDHIMNPWPHFLSQQGKKKIKLAMKTYGVVEV
jgi:hypothetical protein